VQIKTKLWIFISNKPNIERYNLKKNQKIPSP
jgi:hypothetical protein